MHDVVLSSRWPHPPAPITFVVVTLSLLSTLSVLPDRWTKSRSSPEGRLPS